MGQLDKPRFAAGPGKTVTASTSPLSFPITCHGCLCNVQDRDCEALVPTSVAQNSMSAVCHDTLRPANPPQIKLLLLSWANELWNALPWGTFCAAGPTEIVAFPAATVMFVTYTTLFADNHNLSYQQLHCQTLRNRQKLRQKPQIH